MTICPTCNAEMEEFCQTHYWKEDVAWCPRCGTVAIGCEPGRKPSDCRRTECVCFVCGTKMEPVLNAANGTAFSLCSETCQRKLESQLGY